MMASSSSGFSTLRRMEDLRTLLNGQAVEKHEFVDLVDKDSESFVPITKNTITYIVSGLLFNEFNEILMMQEAKSSCHGKWYLPAGRMETNESIEDAVIREVEEETGIVCKPVRLSSVEITFHAWFRFNMICDLTGGKLKTLDEADRESLQARWFPVDQIMHGNLKLRAGDIIPVIKIALHCRTLSINRLNIRPIEKAHTNVTLRLVAIHYNKSNQKLSLVTAIQPAKHLPTCSLINHPSKVNCLEQLLEMIFGSNSPNASLNSIISLEHCGRPSAAHDGICLTGLSVLDVEVRPKIANSAAFIWEDISDEDLAKQLSSKHESDSFVPVRFH